MPPPTPLALCLAAALGSWFSTARADCIEGGTTTIDFNGRAGLVVIALNADIEVLKATLPGNDRSLVWVGRPFPSLTLPRPLGADALTLTLSPALPGCVLRIERY
ncbi:hypothetical protein [Pararhodospirillum photometricum]|uniref:hypothetical protein n=1 Tax=Pararhodospirillum photometricum TaxID=1084 RepID=UPI0012FF2E4B|nr:hypothetical protein [Pararhodospirillum photometricum]